MQISDLTENPVGAGLPANTGEAGAMHRVACFAAVRRLDKPAPTGPGRSERSSRWAAKQPQHYEPRG
ncbi:hypothetical protein F3J44_19520 [Pantoea sp. Tr-811]|nr:hypothetical protein [Pantoea sp. Tr-811]